jgi:hypothetical protein
LHRSPQAGPAEIGVVKLRQKPVGGRKLSNQEEINKRLSLPADLKLPDNFISRQNTSPTLEGPITRATRRQSLSEIGFGRIALGGEYHGDGVRIFSAVGSTGGM